MTEEREALREAVRGLLAGYPTRAAIGTPAGYDAGLWARLCKEIGVAGLAVPQPYGGAGAGLLETHVVLEELGRRLTPAPMLGALLAGQALLRSGDEEACVRLLPGICAGDLIATVAFATGSPTFSVDGDRLSGEVRHVPDAGVADVLIVAAAGSLWEVDAAATVRHPEESLDLTRRLGTVRLDGAAGRRLSGKPQASLWDIGCVALSAEQVGAASGALELTIEYAKTRHQFGRPIGSFQVLQHRLAEAHVRLEAARSASWTAAEALVAGAPEAYRLASVAKVCCSETFQAVAAEMVQMHGGLAITWEHDAHLYFRRAYASAQLFGSPAQHVERLASAAGLA
ncbi:acyl-CoA dehydrogenase family protein [Actinoplanes aureus]|uniref:Acyl-CoA/acyl-ACP dehydrogenase n=1 Tax=Actinoplanes aureus TaxID=2792083 RepID=A0A931CF42_9ACTN|nr:acyl-CoA dehydrogenase family protein [Actinoplanes aureus]MBG0565053.1 acyl-CoA/acyl-ACP dehydrogenase [Actinoplanes aureus]